MYLTGKIKVNEKQMVGSFSDNGRIYEFLAEINDDWGDVGDIPARLAFDDPSQLTGSYTCVGTLAPEGIDVRLSNNKGDTFTLTTPGQEQMQGPSMKGKLRWQ